MTVRANSIVLLMLALSAMSYFDRVILSIAAPTIIRDFSLSETEMGAFFSAFQLGYTVFMAPGGALADRFGPRLVVGVATLGAGLSTGLLAGADRLSLLIGVVPAFFSARLVFGLCTAPLYPSCGRMVSNWIPPEGRARAQALIISGAGAGAALSPWLFSDLVARFGWRVSFAVAAAATSALAVLWFQFARNDPPARLDHPASTVPPLDWRGLIKNRNLMLLTAGYFCLNYFEYIFFYWMYYYFGEIRHLSPAQTVLYTTTLFIFMTVGLAGGGWVSDRIAPRLGLGPSRRAVSVICMISSAILLYFGASASAVIPTVALLSFALGLSCMCEGPFWASAMDAGVGKAGAAGGILNCGGNLGGMLAPIVTPAIAARFGWTWGLYVGSAVVILGVVAWFFVRVDRDNRGLA